MKFTILPNTILIEREDSDKKPNNESHFFYQFCKQLNKQLLAENPKVKQWVKLGVKNIYCKRRGYNIPTNPVPGMNDIPWALRQGTKNNPKKFMFDVNYMIRDVAKDFWIDKKVALTIWNYEDGDQCV